MYIKKSGFTLVEIMVASTIGAFISLVAVGTLKAVISSNDAVDRNISASSEVRFAMNIISRDLMNIYRADNIADTELLGTLENLAEYSTSYIVFYTLNRTKARAFEPEGDLYEVEYYLVKEGDKSKLMRRVWPNPNNQFEPAGVLTTIAEGIDAFELTYFDGEQWYSEWLEDMTTLPQIIEVDITAKQAAGGSTITESFLVNLTRSVTSSSATTGTTSSTTSTATTTTTQ
jgi:type II secretion system protein J